jgi:hypothetical protein
MKRSSQVALLLMGVTGVGATGYAMTKPPPNCVAPGGPSATKAPAAPVPGAEPCPPRRQWSSSGSSYSSWSRTNSSYNSRSSGGIWPIFSRTGTSATPSGSVPLAGRSATITTRSSTTTTTRSGFGSTASSVSRSSSS